MADYAVLFFGELSHNVSQEYAGELLSRLLGSSPRDIELVLSGKRKELASGLTKKQANDLVNSFLECGLICRAEKMSSSQPSSSPNGNYKSPNEGSPYEKGSYRFNWFAFFFTYIYFAGYGSLNRSAMLLTVVSIPGMIPINERVDGAAVAILFAVVALGASAWCGLFANKVLPVKKADFNWLYATASVFVSQGVMLLGRSLMS